MSLSAPMAPYRSRLHDLLQRRPIADHQGRPFELQQLLFLEFRKQAADGLASGSDDLSDVLVGQCELDLHGTVALADLRRP